LITVVEIVVRCERIKTRIQFIILRCTTTRKFFEVTTENQPIQNSYEVAVDAQDSIQGIF